MAPFLIQITAILLICICHVASNCDENRCGCKFFAEPDASILLDFKSKITSDPKGYMSDWKKGVTCDAGWSNVCCDTDGRVRALYLSENKFQGTISPKFGGLTRLEEVYMGGVSYISGDFPVSIGNLVNLQYFYLSSDRLTGSIPSTIGFLVNLIELYVESPLMKGPIPESIGKMINLEYMGFTISKGSSPLPSSWGNLVKLKGLYLDYCSFTGEIPSSFGNLVNLEDLYMSQNKLSGPIPPTIGKLTKLKNLFFWNNSLTGTIPTTLGKLKNLERLDLSSNKLSGNIPIELSNLKKLKYFIMASNYFIGSVPKPIQNLCNSEAWFGLNCLTVSPNDNPKCELDPQRSVSECKVFYKSPSPPPPSQGNTFGLTFERSPNLTRLERTFRHAGGAFESRLSGEVSWAITTNIDWSTELTSWPVRDQKSCAACWAFSSIASIESAIAITKAQRTPPLLSEQHLVDCVGNSNCSGGWPGEALQFSSRNLVGFRKDYPYIGKDRSRACTVQKTGLSISVFEEVNFIGWLGLILAVQQQPVIVALEASGLSFQKYRGGSIFDDSSCFSNGVDHSVLVVGYNILNDPPFWIIRNSWGPNWGENGYMKLALRGGPGICGINTFPAYYAVFKKANDPCNDVNFGEVLGNRKPGGTGTVRPCGQYKCTKKLTNNVCACAAPFVALTLVDGSQTCVPSNPCSYFPTNPCGTGTCVGKNGRYTCLCTLGHTLGELSFDGSPTCVRASKPANNIWSITVPKGFSFPCGLVSQSYGVSIPALKQRNPNVDCTKEIPGGTKLTISTTFPGCAVPYALTWKDNCSTVKSLFGLSSISGPGSPNPFLDCSALYPGQQICVQKGPPPDEPVCEKYFTLDLSRSDSCRTVTKSNFGGNSTSFYRTNIGLYCDRLAALKGVNVAVEQVCLSFVPLGSILSGCKKGFKRVKPGETCQLIFQREFKGRSGLFRLANRNTQCRNPLPVGRPYCLP